jgi:hypothetical protein
MKIGIPVLHAMALALAITVLSGCSSPMMRPAGAINASQDYAVINFMRPSTIAWMVGGGIKFNLWDRDEFIGFLEAGKCVQYKAAPGDHIFLALAFNSAAVKANIQSGKTYYVLASPRLTPMGVSDVALEVLKPNDKRIDEMLQSLKLSTLNKERWDADWKKSMGDPASQKIWELHQSMVRAVQNESVEFSVMNPQDGR